MRRILLIIIAFAGLSSFIPHTRPNEVGGDERPYLSPTHICYDAAAGKAYISLSTAGKIAVLDLRSSRLLEYIDLPFNPGQTVLSGDSKTLFVSDMLSEGKIHLLSLKSKKIEKSIPVGHTPDALAITPDGNLLFAANRFTNDVSVIDINKLRLIKTIAVDRDPKVLSLSPDGQILAVANNIPNSAATDEYISAKVSLINCSTLEVEKHISLANGSQSIEGLAFSIDGKYLYASHILSRNNLPTSQIEHGWINSNAVSVIDVDKREYLTSALLDSYNLGAANPKGMVVSEDGSRLMIALSGVHEVCIIDLPGLHSKLKGKDQNELRTIPNDLRFLYGLTQRVAVAGKSPVHLAYYDGSLLVSSYFSTSLEVFSDARQAENSIQISLGDEPEMSIERRGELFFHDADLCFQKWQSCSSCHPDARVDGLNWDLLNDGAGNPKNGKSLLFAHYTPPVMITGIRKDAQTAVRSGIKYILFTEPQEDIAQAIDAYLMSLRPLPSPRLVHGKLSKDAERGQKIFESTGCSSCHKGQYYTDGQKYDVGTGIESHLNQSFDVPGLSECWRTAPYLYDGRAKTMEEVITKFNYNDLHGVTSGLSENDLRCLVEYVLSL